MQALTKRRHRRTKIQISWLLAMLLSLLPISLSAAPNVPDASDAVPALVKDIAANIGANPVELTEINGMLYFVANDGSHGEELWKSDGTAAGTVLIKDILPGAVGSSPYNLINVNGTLFFAADDGSHGEELWKSDGTAAGTTMVKDILSGSEGSAPFNLTNVGGTLFFSAYDGETSGKHGEELWKSDGTSAGTTMVKDIYPGIEGSYPYNMVDVNGTLFFTAYEESHGEELWKSDGSTSGTKLVKDINPGVDDSYPYNLINSNGTLFFVAYKDTTGEELWMSDGTAAGTKIVKDIFPGEFDSEPNSLINIGGTLYFTASDGDEGNGHGTELWKSNGTAAGTTMVKDIVPGLGDSEPTELTNVDGTLFFAAYDETNGQELWMSDGTAAGTKLVSNIAPGISDSSPTALTAANGLLYFVANDGTNGFELWRSDGTSAKTLLVANINARGGSWNAGNAAQADALAIAIAPELTYVNDALFFNPDDGIHGHELWQLSLSETETALYDDFYGFAGSAVNSETLLNVLANDTVANGTIVAVSTPQLGSATIVAPVSTGLAAGNLGATCAPTTLYTICYKPNANVVGVDVLTYTVSTNGTTYKAAIFINSDTSATVDRHNAAAPVTNGGTVSTEQVLITVGSDALPESLTGNATIVIEEKQPTANPPADTAFGSTIFDITLYETGVARSGLNFRKPIEITITYDEADLVGIDEAHLALFYWNGTAWVDDGIQNCVLDTGSNQLTCEVTHLTEFVLLGTALVPSLSINDALVGLYDTQTVTVPVAFSDGGLSLSALDFTLDYDETCFNYQGANFHTRSQHDQLATDANGHVAVQISPINNGTPASALDDSLPLVTLSFAIKNSCVTTDGREPAVDFNFVSEQLSFRDLNNNQVAGVAYNGTYTLRFNAAPVALTLSLNNIDENRAAGTIIGTFETTDPDKQAPRPGDSHSYSLVAGEDENDNSFFTISGNQLQANSPFNYETKKRYIILVRTTDLYGATFDRLFSIAVNNINEAPTDIQLSNSTVVENAVGAIIGDLSANDEDTITNGLPEAHTYQLVAGTGDTDNAKFAIVDAQLETKVALDFETQTSHSIRMRATDRAGASFEKVFVISVTDVGSVPVANQDFTPTRPFVAVGNGESAALDLLANDSGEGGGSLVVAAVTQGINGGTVVSTGNNVNYTAPADYTGPDSFTYTIRDSASGVESNSATVHLYVVANDAPGDCNSDQHVDAADVAAIVYESLDDADPNAWWAIYSGDFLGSPLGCDANGSKNGADGLASSVTASDLSCAVYIFFGKPENCAALTGADAHANAILRFESGVSGQTGSEIAVGVELLAGENQVAVATFAITYDSTVLTFDPTDADSDGIPDALNLALPADMSAIVIPDVANERILVAVFGTALPLPTLEDDTLATVSFTIKGSVAQKNTALNFSQVTLGSDEATDVGVTTESTMITVIDGQTLLNELFLPFIAR